MLEIKGETSAGFESVQKLFEENFKSGREVDACLCVYYDGKMVVDLSGTLADQSINPGYGRDTLHMTFSAGKAVVAICLAMLVDEGHMEYTDRIVKHWPEFGTFGKEDITVAEVLRHDSGLAWINHVFGVDELTPEAVKNNSVGSQIEAAKQEFPLAAESGKTREYHVMTMGLICNEIMRRVDPKKRTMMEFVRDELSKEFDIHVGCPERDSDRIADLSFHQPSTFLKKTLALSFGGWRNNAVPSIFEMSKLGIDLFMGTTMLKRKSGRPMFTGMSYYKDAILRPTGLLKDRDGKTRPIFELLNTKSFYKLDLPSANVTATARSLAKLAAFMANRGQLQDKKLISKVTIFVLFESSRFHFISRS